MAEQDIKKIIINETFIYQGELMDADKAKQLGEILDEYLENKVKQLSDQYLKEKK